MVESIPLTNAESSLPAYFLHNSTASLIDTETGMYYLNARYYNPSWCRFISPDPVLDANSSVGHNLFSHSGKNPLNCSNATINVFRKNNQPPKIFLRGLFVSFSVLIPRRKTSRQRSGR